MKLVQNFFRFIFTMSEKKKKIQMIVPVAELLQSKLPGKRASKVTAGVVVRNLKLRH